MTSYFLPVHLSCLYVKGVRVGVMAAVLSLLFAGSQRDKLEDLLRTVSTERRRIGQLMVWCLDHADFADEVGRPEHSCLCCLLQ